jgi:hypothetical protein
MRAQSPYTALLRSVVVGAVLLWSAAAWAAPDVSITQTFDTGPEGSVITVGDRLVMTLTIERPREATVRFPSEQPTGRFELLDVDRSVVPGTVEGRVVETITLRYAVFRPGRHKLSSFDLRVLDADGEVSKVSTTEVEVRVDSVLADIKDASMPTLRAPRTVWYEDWTLVWILGTFGGLLLALGIGAIGYKFFRPPPPPPPPPPPRPAHEIALEKLGAIAGADLITQGLWEEFYVRVSEATREYFGRRYEISLAHGHGLELTTEELLELLGDVNWPRGLDLRAVELFLQECDIVKFAAYSPTQEEANALINQAFQIVELTKPTLLGAAVLASTEGGDA